MRKWDTHLVSKVGRPCYIRSAAALQVSDVRVLMGLIGHVARVLAGMRRGLHAAASIVLALLGPNKAKDLRERSKPKAKQSTLMCHA